MTETLTKEQLKTIKESSLIYDVFIIGGGIAGLTASIYAARGERKTIVIESKLPGGQITTSHLVENWPTYPDPISGMEIGERLEKQVKGFGVPIEWGIIKSVLKMEDLFVITTEAGKTYYSRTVIVATGVDPKELDVPGEVRLKGRGVSYCATCDGAFYKGLSAAVVGGGDSAIKEALYLSNIVEKLYIIHRRDRLRAEKVLANRIQDQDNVEVVWDSVVEEILGAENKVSGLKIKNVKTEQTKIIDCAGVFIYVGALPNTGFLEGLVSLTEHGFVVAGEDMKTNIPGLFVAGDVREKELRQLVTAASDGAAAAHSAERYLG